MMFGLIMKTLLALCLAFSSLAAYSQSAPNPKLLAEIENIKAIDHHSHPPKLVSASEKDEDYDALPCDPATPFDPPYAVRPENPMYMEAWKALWNYPYNDRSPEHVRFVLDAKAKAKQEQGDNYANWILDRLGIETEFANRIALGRGLQPPRFRWVPFDDALLSPLDNSAVADNPDRKPFYQLEGKLLQRYMKDLNLTAAPRTLEEYTARVVTPTLERQKQGGAVAIKFEAAYLRSLDFEPASQAEAAAIYGRYANGGAPSKQENLKLQDYLFRYIAAEAGRLKMAVHFHTGGGCGSYFDLPGADPALLSSVIDDASLRNTTFVLVHGGAQTYSKKVAYLMSKPNVYADFSEITWLLSPRALSYIVRNFLEWYPEKTMFGTDLSPGTPDIDWEEIGWVTSQTGRRALAMALTGMMDDGEISYPRAVELAHMVLHDNAAKLYGIQ